MVVHQMLKNQQDMMATNIDLTSRIVLPYLLYPAVTASTLICFLNMTVGSVLCGVGILVSITTQMVLTKRLNRKQTLQQLRTVQAFAKLQPDSPDFETMAEAVFRAFDLDNSGNLDEREFRDMLNVIYPGMPRQLQQDTVAAVRHFFDLNGHIQVSSFTDAMFLAFTKVSTDASMHGYNVENIKQKSRQVMCEKTLTRGKLTTASIMKSVQDLNLLQPEEPPMQKRTRAVRGKLKVVNAFSQPRDPALAAAPSAVLQIVAE